MNQFLHRNILITGSTGSGKSNFLNKIIMTLIDENSSDDLKLFLIDPKGVEFGVYEGMTHIMSGVIYKSEEAKKVLSWAMDESLRRLNNKQLKNTLPEIVIIIDEFSDLICSDKDFFEDCVEKITTLSETTGIYLVISTSRPSPKDVYTNKIMNCFSNKICFRVGSEDDSLLIIGQKGAEKLSEQGSCLIKDSANSKITSFQVPFISVEQMKEKIESIKALYSYVYCFKCRECSLEFRVFSWKNDWAEKNIPFCPECGKRNIAFLDKKTSEKSISRLLYE